MTVGIVTDSSCDLRPAEVRDSGVEVVPLYIRFGTEEFVDREEITVEDFYRRMARSEHLPQTAAPSPGRFRQAYRKLLDEGCDSVVCITLSSAISATMQAAAQAADGIAADVRVVDSRSVTAGLGTLVLQAARRAAEGADAAAVVDAVSEASSRTRVFGALDTLENLRKGGRIGGAAAMLGSVLSIKPIVDLSSGTVEEAAKQRTRKKALAWLRNHVRSAAPVEHLSVMHGAAADADRFRAMISAAVGHDHIRMADIGPVVGAHAGAGVIGVAYQVPA